MRSTPISIFHHHRMQSMARDSSATPDEGGVSFTPDIPTYLFDSPTTLPTESPIGSTTGSVTDYTTDSTIISAGNSIKTASKEAPKVKTIIKKRSGAMRMHHFKIRKPQRFPKLRPLTPDSDECNDHQWGESDHV
jgi:hypothetical protein